MIEGQDTANMIPIALTPEEASAILGLSSYLGWVRPASTKALVEAVLNKIKEAPKVSGSLSADLDQLVSFALNPYGRLKG